MFGFVFCICIFVLMMCLVLVGFTTVLQLLYCLDVCIVSGQLALLH